MRALSWNKQQRNEERRKEILQTDPDTQRRDRGHCHCPSREAKNIQVAQTVVKVMFHSGVLKCHWSS